MGEDKRKGSGFEVISALWSRRRWLAVVVFATSFSAAVSLVMALPSLYRSTATVLVSQEQVSETFVRSSITGELEPRLHTISQAVLSRSRLQELIVDFDLYPDLRRRASPEAVIERMRRDIKLELKGVAQRSGHSATIAFTLGYQGWDPQTVAKVTNTLVSFYVKENERMRRRQASGTTEFLKGQLAEVKGKLNEQERRVGGFKDRFMGELPEQQGANLATLGRLNAQLSLNSENQIRAMERREKLLKQIGEADSPDPAASPDGSVAQMSRLRRELAELRTRFSDKYPDVARVKAEIAALERQLSETKIDGRPRTEPATPTEPALLRLTRALSEAEAEMNILKADEKRLRQTVATYERRVENTPKQEQELQKLTRDYDAIKDFYSSLLKRHEDAQIAETMERQEEKQFRILDPAISPTEPAGPNRLQLMLMGFMLSLAIAAGAVVLAEQLDTSFHSVDHLRAFTRVPVLLSIPRIVTKADIKQERSQFCLGVAAAMLGAAFIVGASYYLGHGNQELVWMLARR